MDLTKSINLKSLLKLLCVLKNARGLNENECTGIIELETILQKEQQL